MNDGTDPEKVFASAIIEMPVLRGYSDPLPTISSIIAIIDHIFGNYALDEAGQRAADVNDDGEINVHDIIAIIDMVFDNQPDSRSRIRPRCR